MINVSYKSLISALPFSNSSPYQVANLYQSKKEILFETLENNNFSRNMLKHVNGFSKDNYTCGYYQEHSIHNLKQKHLPDCLKSFHLNIVSYNKNGTYLAYYLSCLSVIFDIICLTEIRLTSRELIEKEFPDHDIYIDEPTTKTGGVALLLRKNKFDNITELDPIKQNRNCVNCLIENKWLSFKINNQECTIGGIYRHPTGNIAHFNDALNGTISKIKANSLAITLGDININLMNEENVNTSTYLNNYFVNNFIPCITIPTCIKNRSAMIIDHIFVKIPPKLIQIKCSSGNLITDLSDHLPNFTFLDLKIQTLKKRPFIRLFTETNKKLFAEKLLDEAPLINDNDLTDPNRAYDIFSNNYHRLFNKYFPLTRMSKKAAKDKPHITSGIKVSIKHKNRLYKKYKENSNEVNHAIYNRFKNNITKTIRTAEKMYYRKIISSHTNSTTNLWKIFGKILNKKKVKHKNTSSLLIDDVKVTEPQLITNSFNKFFCEIGEQLADKFDNVNISEHKKFLKDPAPQSIFLHNTNVTEIINTVRNLKNSNSTGHDEISTKFIKLSLPILAPALVKIFNLSLSSGIYPDRLKIAEVLPIFKKGSPTSVNSYRPISILSSINKIFEKIIYSRLTKYIDKFQLLYRYQYGFRKNHSTDHALTELVDQIRFSIDNKEISLN